MLYTQELKEHGHAAVLIFDGAGTEGAEEFTRPDSTHKLTPMYRASSEHGVTECNATRFFVVAGAGQ